MARLDRRWARCARRACTAPPYSVWRCLLYATHRGRHSPRRSQHAACTRPAVSHRRAAWVQHVRPPPRRTATWPRVNGRAGARDGKRTRLPSAPLRWSRFATRGVAARPHATRCTAISRPARGRSRTRLKASAACGRVAAGARAAESQRSEQLRAALDEGLSSAPLRARDASSGAGCRRGTFRDPEFYCMKKECLTHHHPAPDALALGHTSHSQEERTQF